MLHRLFEDAADIELCPCLSEVLGHSELKAVTEARQRQFYLTGTAYLSRCPKQSEDTTGLPLMGWLGLLQSAAGCGDKYHQESIPHLDALVDFVVGQRSVPGRRLSLVTAKPGGGNAAWMKASTSETCRVAEKLLTAATGIANDATFGHLLEGPEESWYLHVLLCAYRDTRLVSKY